MARVVVRNALFYGSQKISKEFKNLPKCVYTDPEIA